MAQHKDSLKPAKLPDPEQARTDRERILALAVVELGDANGARAKVARDHEVQRYEVTRAMQKHGEWANEEVRRRRREEAKAARHEGLI